ncbi:MAG: proline--tRNA ligase [Planctomycetota bacterium]
MPNESAARYDVWSATLVPTLRQAPGDAEVPSHQLMLRAGLIRKLGAGSYTYLPLGLRSLNKVIAIIKEEMHAAGAAEVFMPTLQPIELWQKTGRDESYGDNLFQIDDRHGRHYALGPTHEEVVTDLVGSCISSYKDLPKTVYQIQTKFRDEFRPRFGVLRSREFLMKDAYSFHASLEGEGGLDETYDKQYAAYQNIFTRSGVPFMVVEAEAGPIGGNASHEFMVPSPTGEDTILTNDAGYAANVEKCETGPRPSDLHGEPTGDLEPVETPGCPGIDDVVTFFKKKLGSKLATKNMLKTLVCKSDTGWVLSVVRGDHELNEAKLRQATHPSVQLAEEAQARAAGFVIGFVGPHVAVDRDDIEVIVDPDAAQAGFWVTGGNQPDTHVKHFNWKRELGEEDKRRYAKFNRQAIRVADIRNAVEGDPAPEAKGGGKLRATKGIEVGHVFKLGSKYTEALGVSVSGEENDRITPIMGCYGIGVNRILAAAIESAVTDDDGNERAGHDDSGIVWPVAIAPYEVCITAIGYEPDSQVADVCANLAQQLAEAGHDVLIDDRDERPGVKFKDADLIGFPLRITVGNKGLSADTPEVELKTRDGSLGPKGTSVPLTEAVKRATAALEG